METMEMQCFCLCDNLYWHFSCYGHIVLSWHLQLKDKKKKPLTWMSTIKSLGHTDKTFYPSCSSSSQSWQHWIMPWNDAVCSQWGGFEVGADWKFRRFVQVFNSVIPCQHENLLFISDAGQQVISDVLDKSQTVPVGGTVRSESLPPLLKGSPPWSKAKVPGMAGFSSWLLIVAPPGGQMPVVH